MQTLDSYSDALDKSVNDELTASVGTYVGQFAELKKKARRMFHASEKQINIQIGTGEREKSYLRAYFGNNKAQITYLSELLEFSSFPDFNSFFEIVFS